MLTRTRNIAEGALALRDWGARRLLSDTPPAEPPPGAATDAWRLFLWWERCAALLQHSLAEHPVALPPHAAAELRGMALREMRRILSARAQLRRVAALASDLDIPVIVLKGTADVARGVDSLLMDVDVLTRPQDAERLATALDAEGFTPSAGAGHWHLQARTDPGALQVEVHRAVTGFDDPAMVPWEEAREIDGLAPLLALAPGDHAWTVIGQAVRKHPDRRQRIRDLYLIRDALRRATPAEQALLRQRAAEDPYGTAASTMIELAEAGGILPEGTPARRRLRRMYLLQSRRIDAPPGTMRNRLWLRAVESVAAGPWENVRRFRRTHAYAGRGIEPLRTPARLATFGVAAVGAFFWSIEGFYHRGRRG